MKYSIECRADSKLLIGNSLSMVEGTREYIFASDKDGFLTSVKIITKVEDPEKFYSKIEDGNGKVKSITIESDPNIVDDLETDFRYIESSLAFIGNLKKIHWEDAKHEWIPETGEEKAKLKVFAYSLSRKHPDSPTRLTKDNFVEIVKNKSKFDCLTTLKAFYREGKNSFDQSQYVIAFYNLYFIVEDMFGGGKTKNKQIEENFQSSKELKETIKWAMDTQIKTSAEHSKNITKYLSELHLQDTPEDIVALLVRMRGRVHHYTSKSSLKQATPFSQGDFESIAFLTMAIALLSILKEIAKINRGQTQIKGVSS